MRYLTAVLIGLSCVVARGDDTLTRNSIPNKWIEPILPEDLPDLEYPAYFNDLEKAEMEAFTGRYKKSLQTLMKLPADADPLRVAMVKGTSFAATGRRQKALEALSTPSVVKEPKAQVRRAIILGELGRTDEA